MIASPDRDTHVAFEPQHSSPEIRAHPVSEGPDCSRRPALGGTRWGRLRLVVQTSPYGSPMNRAASFSTRPILRRIRLAGMKQLSLMNLQTLLVDENPYRNGTERNLCISE
jgi:hypothetical protein